MQQLYEPEEQLPLALVSELPEEIQALCKHWPTYKLHRGPQVGQYTIIYKNKLTMLLTVQFTSEYVNNACILANWILQILEKPFVYKCTLMHFSSWVWFKVKFV